MMRIGAGLTAVLMLAGSAIAAPITPTYDTFGELTGATFGGSGIPNDPVAITTLTIGGDTITLGLSAHQRFENDPLTDNGAGIYSAKPGANFGDPTFSTTPSSTLGATWNAGYYIDVQGGGSFADYNFELVYDFDPASDTDEADHGVLDFDAALTFLSIPPAAVSQLQGSENMLFSFFANGALPFITVPTAGSFDPNARGEYTLALVVRDLGGTELGRSAIQVNVVPEPTSLALLGLGSLGLGFAGLKRRRTRSN